jgi:hypothetical protein
VVAKHLARNNQVIRQPEDGPAATPRTHPKRRDRESAPTVNDPAVLELKDDAIAHIQVLAVPLRDAALDAEFR